MAKEKTELSKDERKALKAAKKAALEPSDSGVSKPKSDKKEKKEKKAKRAALAEKALNEINDADKVVEVKGDKKEIVADLDVDVKSDVEMEAGDDKKSTKLAVKRPIGALVPFANPLADEKVGKKVFKVVKKAAAQRTLKRGVKEVVKALRKSPASTVPNTTTSDPIGVVVIAADISPMDVISHIPVLAEDHSIPYIYVTSRAELGIAGQTKRPTSVVMVTRDMAKGKTDDGGDWPEAYKGLVKVVEREGRHVKV